MAESTFQRIIRERREDAFYEIFQIEEESFLSYFFERSRLQESFRFRAQFYALQIANVLIDEKGDLAVTDIPFLINLIKKRKYPIFRENDFLIFSHIERVLSWIAGTSAYVKFFKKFRMPLCHKKADEVIRETVFLNERERLEDRHVRKAVLSAWLTPLRQNVGSCFATAPAIHVQNTQPQNFLKDMLDLLNMGKLTRTFEGKEYSVPFSSSWGVGDATNPLNRGYPLWENPGLLAAFEKVGIIDPKLTFLEKAASLKSLLEKTTSKNTQELLRDVLFSHYGIDEKDVQREKAQEKTRAQTQGFHQLRFVAMPISQKSKNVQNYLRDYEGALSAFKRISDNPLLKTWEFTLASFVDVKVDFAKWNLYVSLGLDQKEPGGLGEFLFQIVDEQLQKYNQELEILHEEYLQVHDRLRVIQNLARNDRSGQHTAEMESASREVENRLLMRDIAAEKAKDFAHLFAFLIDQYVEKFPEYFQEVYDPNMHEAALENYDDSPAGFRLVCKHGRSDPMAWTAIHNAEEYVDSLREFFSNVEREIIDACTLEKAKEDIPAITTRIIHFLQSEVFIDGALKRMAVEQKAATKEMSLDAIKSLEKKPWSYTSGGTMQTLLKAYYRKEKPLTVIETNPTSEEALFHFFYENTSTSKETLMYSPTHAFTFLPQEMQKNLGNSSPELLKEKAKLFYRDQDFKASQQKFLLDAFCTMYPESFYLKRFFPSHIPHLSLPDFKSHLLGALQRQKLQVDWEKLVDGFLHQALPLHTKEESLGNMTHLLTNFFQKDTRLHENVSKHCSKLSGKYLMASSFYKIATEIFSDMQNELFFSEDFGSKVLEKGRELGYFAPKPIIFADTNWPKSFFGFLINPASFAWEFWVFDRIGWKGFPMREWKMWFQGDPSATWAMYPNSDEYT